MPLPLLILLAPALLLALGAAFTFVHARWIERRYPPTGRFVEVEGCRLHYREEGPERDAARGTIVLLHGASSNLVESMLGLGARLSQRYRVIAFDRPGHGWSERKRGLGEAEPARQAALLAERLAAARRAQRRHRRAFLVGNDRPPSRPRSCRCDRGDPRPLRHHLALAGRHDRLVPPPDRFPGGLADVPHPRRAGPSHAPAMDEEKDVLAAGGPAGHREESLHPAGLPAQSLRSQHAGLRRHVSMRSWSRARATGTSGCRRS